MILSHGNHRTKDAGVCLLEAVAYLSGERHTDAPCCACPILTDYGRRLNDGPWPSDEVRTEALFPLIPLISGSKANLETERKRAAFLVTAATKTVFPYILKNTGKSAYLPLFRRLPDLHTAADAHEIGFACDYFRYSICGLDATKSTDISQKYYSDGKESDASFICALMLSSAAEYYADDCYDFAAFNAVRVGEAMGENGLTAEKQHDLLLLEADIFAEAAKIT